MNCERKSRKVVTVREGVSGTNILGNAGLLCLRLETDDDDDGEAQSGAEKLWQSGKAD